MDGESEKRRYVEESVNRKKNVTGNKKKCKLDRLYSKEKLSTERSHGRE